MTPDKIVGVLKSYCDLLTWQYGTQALRDSEGVSLPTRLYHLHWMCVEAIKFVEEGKLEKANRWLGFLQGAFWAMGIRSVEEAKRDNKPEGEAFDKEHV